jgi:hypothetical protein
LREGGGGYGESVGQSHLTEFRYRIYEPETLRDLPLELVQEWTSPLPLSVGMTLDTFGADEPWRIAAIEDDPDPAYSGRVFFEFVERFVPET